MASRATVGVADHNGWAHLVTVTSSDAEIPLLDRRRVAYQLYRET